jgi:acid phosphatase type 7
MRVKFLFILLISLMGNTPNYATVDKFRLIWNENPATSALFAWNQASGANPVVYYTAVEAGKVPQRYDLKATPTKTTVFRGMNNQFCQLNHLKPNTLYYLIIKDSEGFSRKMRFRTAPDLPTTRLSIIAGGDSRNNRAARRSANLLAGKLRPHCILFNGDMTDSDTNLEWQTWFDDWQLTIGTDGFLIPIVPARGNHEKDNQTLAQLFLLPATNYYALNIGGDLLRVYSLNSLMPAGGDQKAWFQADLDANPNPIWKIVQYHQPMRPHTQGKDPKDEPYKQWTPLFAKHNVKLAIESDAHVAKTTFPIRASTEAGSVEGFIRDDARGTTYIGEGCWGAPLRPFNKVRTWTHSGGSFNHFKWLWVGKDTLEIRTVKTDNAAEVEAVSQPFQIPVKLDIFKPAAGEVVFLKP